MNANKVVWQEGMLLRPQHLQQNDRYFEHQIKNQVRLLHRNAWGFFDLQIDPQNFKLSKIVISRASGVLPDGSFFDLGNNRERLMLEVPPDTGNASVYLALPLLIGGTIEARHPDQADVLARFTLYDAEVSDSNAGSDSSTLVSCAQPDFRLLLGEQSNHDA